MTVMFSYECLNFNRLDSRYNLSCSKKCAENLPHCPRKIKSPSMQAVITSKQLILAFLCFMITNNHFSKFIAPLF